MEVVVSDGPAQTSDCVKSKPLKLVDDPLKRKALYDGLILLVRHFLSTWESGLAQDLLTCLLEPKENHILLRVDLPLEFDVKYRKLSLYAEELIRQHENRERLCARTKKPLDRETLTLRKSIAAANVARWVYAVHTGHPSGKDEQNLLRGLCREIKVLHKDL